jgi:ferric-dicitrate binding protein FerR (iron transport regulator)
MQELLIKYINGEATPEESLAVTKWASEHEENQKMFEEYQLIWNGLHRADQIPNEAQAEQHILSRIKPGKKAVEFPFKTFYRIAAALLLIVLATYYFLRSDFQKPTSNATFVGVADTTAVLDLPDGSKVWLYKGARISYDIPFSKREVELTGRAFFEVEHDPERPFVVQLQHTCITVLGTSFNVWAVDDVMSIVTVNTGRVAFASHGQTTNDSVVLVQHQQGIFVPDDKHITTNSDIDPNIFAWKTGKLVFDDSPMTYVARTLQVVYGHGIQLTDPAIGELRVNTSFENQSLEEILLILSKTLDLKVTRVGRDYQISRNL